MPHFFISYAKKDTRDLALQLEAALNVLPNMTAWVDKSLRAGRSWEIQIQSEIDRCDYMIVLYSPDINRHKHGEEESYVLTEISYAKYTVRKPIIPVMAQKTEPPISLTTAHYIDFAISTLHLDDLVTAICDEVATIAGTKSIPSIPIVPPFITQATVELQNDAQKFSSIDVMPTPFAWIDIPGKFYKIAKYPITNAQFSKFIEADGYNQEKWWTNEGWLYLKKFQLKKPLYWTDTKWNGATQPIVGISWYEAVAFCLWLSDITQEKIMLPTEDQWEYAAKGYSYSNVYPWGPNWDSKRCNNNVDGKSIRKTTPVTQYEGKGDSTFGVVDMAGNVWEWCVTDFDKLTNDINSAAPSRSTRGGSWRYISADGFRCNLRNWNLTGSRSEDIGFRISRS